MIFVVLQFLFKNDSRQFTDKQTQLYLFSSVCACCTWVIDHFVGVESHSDHMPSKYWLSLFFIALHNKNYMFHHSVFGLEHTVFKVLLNR
jgi:hypothetical protein